MARRDEAVVRVGRRQRLRQAQRLDRRLSLKTASERIFDRAYFCTKLNLVRFYWYELILVQVSFDTKLNLVRAYFGTKLNLVQENFDMSAFFGTS